MTNLVRKTLVNYAPASNLLHNEKIREMIAAGKTIYHFGFGQSPFPIMDKAADRLGKHAAHCDYLPVAGIKALREAIRDFHKKYDDIDFSADDVIVGPGSKELIFLLMNIFEGDVMVISPSWTSYKPQVMLSGHKAYVVPTTMADEWKVTPESLSKYLRENHMAPNRLLIINNPDNPTGTLYNEQELHKLSEVFERNKIIVLSDEIYGRLTFEGNDFVSLAKVYPEGTILCTGMSKWASMGGWRLGYHVYPKQLSDLKEAVRAAASHTYTSVAAPIQYAVNEVLRDTETCDCYMKHTRRIMTAVANYCYEELTSINVQCVRPRGGFYVFPNFDVIKEPLKARGIVKCEDMVNAIFEESSVSVMAGGPAFLRPDNELTVRLCFVNFDGAEALKASENIGLDKNLPEDFVQKHCSNVHDGIQALVKWVMTQLI